MRPNTNSVSFNKGFQAKKQRLSLDQALSRFDPFRNIDQFISGYNSYEPGRGRKK